MKKRIFLILLAVSVVLGAWCIYASVTSNPWDASTIGDIPAPLGYTRVDAPKGSYAHYLRSLPLRARGSKVHLYSGGESYFQFLSAGVIDQDILSNDEQCADVTMRLRAEYLWQQGRYGEICFRNVNGQNMRYSGGRSRKAFERYMRSVYGLCSTYSVYHETKPRPISQIQPGDVLVFPAPSWATYGHAVIVVDVARNSSGRIAVMCVEGSTPALEKHIIRNFNLLRNPWFILDEDDESIWISAFHFNKEELRHY